MQTKCTINVNVLLNLLFILILDLIYNKNLLQIYNNIKLYSNFIKFVTVRLLKSLYVKLRNQNEMNKINTNHLKLIAKLYINSARLNENSNNIY